MNKMQIRINHSNFLMKAVIALVSFIFVLSSFSLSSAQVTEKPQTGQKFQLSKSPEIQQVKPKKPVKVKLKRGAKGEYSWDLSGDSVDDVVKADKRLRKLLDME